MSDSKRFVDLNIYVDGEKAEQLRLSEHSDFGTEIEGTAVSIEVLRIVEYNTDSERSGGDA